MNEALPPKSSVIVFLHHFGGSAQTWTEVIARLARLEPSTHCFAIDLFGFGTNNRSEDAAMSFNLDRYADQVADFVEANGLKRFVLVGHSMGGKIAMAVAARNPSRLSALLLVAPSPPTPEPMTDADLAELMAAHDNRSIAHRVVSKSTFTSLSSAVENRTVSDMLNSSPDAWRAWLKDGSRENIADRVSSINVSVIVLAAAHDPVMTISLLTTEIIDRIEFSKLVVVPDSGHLVPLDAPTAVVRYVRDLLKTVDGEPTSDGSTLTTYPVGTVQSLLQSDLVTDPTRQVLSSRLVMASPSMGIYFNAGEIRTLRSVCDRLVPHNAENARPIDIAGAIDARLAAGSGDGWRYEELPCDADAYRVGLRTLNAMASATGRESFCDLDGQAQYAILRSIQDGKLPNLSRFFEELLAEVSAIYFSHPLVQDEIGYAGMADKHGWKHISLNLTDPQEPQPCGAINV